jgi:hypothetical protein
LTRTFIQAQANQSQDLINMQLRALLKYWQDEVTSVGSKAIIRHEEANLLHAIRLGIASKHAGIAARLLASLYSGLYRVHDRAEWQQLYEAALITRLRPELRGRLLFQSGSLCLQAGMLIEAERQFDAAATITSSGDLAFKCKLGSALTRHEQGDGQAARRILNAASKGGPVKNKLQANYILGIINSTRKEFGAADKKFASILAKRALLTANAASRVHMSRALVQLELGNPKHALKQLRLATDALMPTNQHATERVQLELLRSFVFYKMNELVQAERALGRVRDMVADNEESAHRAFFETSLGRIHGTNKKSAEAADFLKSAAKLWKKLGQPQLAADAASLLLRATSDDY